MVSQFIQLITKCEKFLFDEILLIYVGVFMLNVSKYLQSFFLFSTKKK